jgi:hypothetical protein
MKWKPTGVWKEEITKKITKYLQANEKKKRKKTQHTKTHRVNKEL